MAMMVRSVDASSPRVVYADKAIGTCPTSIGCLIKSLNGSAEAFAASFAGGSTRRRFLIDAPGRETFTSISSELAATSLPSISTAS